jgi:hypothetical protein
MNFVLQLMQKRRPESHSAILGQQRRFGPSEPEGEKGATAMIGPDHWDREDLLKNARNV